MDHNQRELVNRLSKLQVLTIRYIERNTSLKYPTHRDAQRILGDGYLTVKYQDGVENLRKVITKFCSNSNYLMLEISKLESDINKSEIANLRFGLETQNKFIPLEHDLDKVRMLCYFYYLTSMVGVKYASEVTGVKQDTIKQACQQERLMNTQKVGKTWIVHLPEVENYWNINKQ